MESLLQHPLLNIVNIENILQHSHIVNFHKENQCKSNIKIPNHSFLSIIFE